MTDRADSGKNERTASVGETLSLMSHQINNVLQGINGGSHLVEVGLEKADFAIVTRGWEIIRKNQAEISELFSGLLDLGKPFVPNRALVDLVKITQETLDRMSEYFQTSGITCLLDGQPSSLIVNADVEALTRAIENLVGVAVRASRLDTTCAVDLQFKRSGQEVSLEIEYQGAEICLDPEAILNPVGREELIVGGLEFAVSRKVMRGHSGDILLAKNGDGSHRISLSLPIDSYEDGLG